MERKRSFPFIQPKGVTQGFALSVWAVLHNKAQHLHWTTIDEAHSAGKALRWIKAIYRANGTAWSKDEETWWRTELETELREMRTLGMRVPDKAFELARTEPEDEYTGMSVSDACDLLIDLCC